MISPLSLRYSRDGNCSEDNLSGQGLSTSDCKKLVALPGTFSSFL